MIFIGQIGWDLPIIKRKEREGDAVYNRNMIFYRDNKKKN